MTFTPSGPSIPRPGLEKQLLILFQRNDLLAEMEIKEAGKSKMDDEVSNSSILFDRISLSDDGKDDLFIGYMDSYPCFVREIAPPVNETPGWQALRKPGEMENTAWYPIRRLLPLLSEPELALCFRANHLRLWNKESKFCSRCGKRTKFHEKETSKLCPSCGLVQYPRISPAVITRITKGDKILLAHNMNFPGEMHSLIAGFVDAGENLESAVAREIREEVGLEVKNIRYFHSQSWPFPNSLMCGFTAEWESGEIIPDEEEIDKAAWFSKDEMPTIPPYGSISRIIIDDFTTGAYLKNKPC
ncbi:MAG: NAD(+) diphosphatase [Spirochaetales bacterium]|nr:NAD(+) diphosphatase [Spirochaetales bacterium]